MEANPMYSPQYQAQPQMQYVSVGRRFLAHFLDGIVLAVIESIIILLLTLALGNTQKIAIGGTLAALIAFVYFVAMEATRGATLGKMALGIRVVKVDGSPISWSESIVRNLLRIIDALFGYLLGAILVWTSPTRQRFGDRIAQTVVIRS
jgi:uncharacterized RDD family membrane protein YckC